MKKNYWLLTRENRPQRMKKVCIVLYLIFILIHFLGDKGDTTDAKTMEDTVDTFPFSFSKGRSAAYVYSNTIISYV
jgi:hypothetical protein